MLEDIRDIKPPVYFAGNYLFLFIILGIILLTGLVFLAIFLKKRLKKQPQQSYLPQKSAYQIAREAFLALQAQNLPKLGKIKEYYFGLSDVVRRYIENRFNIKAPEMTTEEFLSFLRDSDTLSAAHKNLLKEFLSLCDIVKFARYGPTRQETDNSFNAAVKLVEETKNAF